MVMERAKIAWQEASMASDYDRKSTCFKTYFTMQKAYSEAQSSLWDAETAVWDTVMVIRRTSRRMLMVEMDMDDIKWRLG